MFFDTDSRRIQVDDRIAALERDYRAGSSALGASRAAGSSPCGSPSQQPSLNRHAGHCHVPWRHSIAAPHRQHASVATAANLETVPDAAATLVRARRRSSVG